MYWHFPPYLTCFGPLWRKDSLILVLTVMHDQPNNDPDYRNLTFAHSRLHKSYIGAIYICVSCSAPSEILNLIFKTWFARFKGRFSLVIKICNKKILEPNLDHSMAFLVYVEDGGTHSSWGYLKSPILGFLTHLGDNRSNQCIPPCGMCKDISFGQFAFVVNIVAWPMRPRLLAAKL